MHPRCPVIAFWSHIPPSAADQPLVSATKGDKGQRGATISNKGLSLINQLVWNVYQQCPITRGKAGQFGDLWGDIGDLWIAHTVYICEPIAVLCKLLRIVVIVLFDN